MLEKREKCKKYIENESKESEQEAVKEKVKMRELLEKK